MIQYFNFIKKIELGCSYHPAIPSRGLKSNNWRLFLPSSLNMLNAIEWKTVDEQLTENKKRFLFWKGWNLDESFAVVIGLNAPMNLMELANQPLPTPGQEHEFYNHIHNHCK